MKLTSSRAGILLCIAAAVAADMTLAANWWNSDWQKRAPITVTASTNNLAAG